MNILGILSFRTLKKVFRRLEFISQGREGTVIYHEGRKQIRFYMEMGGDNVVFYLRIPAKAEWKQLTGFPANERDEILNYVAMHTQKAQAPSCIYRITENEILFIRS